MMMSGRNDPLAEGSAQPIGPILVGQPGRDKDVSPILFSLSRRDEEPPAVTASEKDDPPLERAHSSRYA
jgi:hypothetical protein